MRPSHNHTDESSDERRNAGYPAYVDVIITNQEAPQIKHRRKSV